MFQSYCSRKMQSAVFVSVYLCISCHQITLSPPVFLPAIIVRMEMPALAGNSGLELEDGSQHQTVIEHIV